MFSELCTYFYRCTIANSENAVPNDSLGIMAFNIYNCLVFFILTIISAMSKRKRVKKIRKSISRERALKSSQFNLWISFYLLYYEHLIITLFVLQVSTEKSDKKNTEYNVSEIKEANRSFHFLKWRTQTLANLLWEMEMVNIFFLGKAYFRYNGMKSILKKSGQKPSICNAIPIFCELHHQVLDHQWMKECFSHTYILSLKKQMI